MKKLFLLSFAAFLSACGGGEDRNADGSDASISIDGSSTVYPISEAAAEEYRVENRKAKVTIGVSGTGGGFKKFIRQEIDITGASRPIMEGEHKGTEDAGFEYIELPIAYDGLAIVVHPENDWVDYITVEELKKIWEPSAQGKIKRWNQVRASWPDKEIHLFGAGTESGTFDYFTEAIVGKAKESRGDYTASEDDNVLVQGVSTDRLALGYFGVAYFSENKDKLKLVPVDDGNDNNGKGPVLGTDENVKNGTYQPLSRPLLIYVNANSVRNNAAITRFVNFFIDNADELVEDAKYVPLSAETYELVRKRFQKKITGSLFLNLETTVGVNLDEILK